VWTSRYTYRTTAQYVKVHISQIYICIISLYKC
jgi:hypothetical protein